MATFQYQIRDRSGKYSKGQMDGASAREVAAKLHEDGHFIMNLQNNTETSRGTHMTKRTTEGKVKLKDLLMFTRMFGVMIRAGVNLINCLNLLNQQTDSKYLSMVITEVRRSVEGGDTLHVALSRYPKIFPIFYMHMVEAGEAGGQLETVLDRLGTYLENDFILKKKVTGAMVYPSVIISVGIVVVLLLMTFAIPQFLSIFKDAGMDLPLPTRMLIASTNFLQSYWWLVFGAIGGGALGAKLYWDKPKGRNTIEKLIYRMAIFGPVMQKLASARFARTLATLLDSGVMITNALDLVEKAIGNTVVAGAIAYVRLNITKGSGLAKPLEETGVFPPMVTQMVAVGEETGELSNMLNRLADFYEKEASYAVESLTTLIEPAIIICMGLGVAFLVSAIMLPMFDLGQAAVK